MAHLSVNGARLFVREAGTGPPLLLIHGAGPDSRGWGATFDDLARDHRVIAFDRRGFGQSVDQPLTDWHGHAEDAAALLEELGAAPAVVVGWSGGGLVALDLAVNHPEAVSGLVIAETALHGRRKVTPSLAVTFLRARLERALGREQQAARTWGRWVTAEAGGGSTWDRDDFPEERREAFVVNARGIWRDLASGDGSHLSPEALGAIERPVTCIRGDMSQPWFAKTTEVIRELIPHAEVRVLPGTNHALTFHKPIEFAQAIREAAAAAG